MIEFIASIFSGVAYAVVVLLWNLGLIAAPALPEERPATAAVVQQVPVEKVVTEVDLVKEEIENLKKELAEIKKQKSAAAAPKPKPVPIPAPIPVPAPVPVPTPAAPRPGTFVTPSGAVVDAQGNLISLPPTSVAPSPSSSQPASAPTPAPTPAWPPTTGSTVTIGRNVVIAVDFNSNMACNQLGFGGAELRLCELYKNSKDSYVWVFTD